MYNWRRMTDDQREYVLNIRKLDKLPWHSPPHRYGENTVFHLTAACFEHKHLIGLSPERLAEFEKELIESIKNHSVFIYAWCILPNHYHLLIKSDNMKLVIKEIGKFHGRTSFKWNTEEQKRGRTVWYRCLETAIKSDNHFWSTINYIHNNPVHHRYVSKWQNWSFSSARDYIESIGKSEAMQIWKEFPLDGYGKGWDDPNL